MLTKSQIDKLGDRLRDGQINADALRQLDSMRAEYVNAYKHVDNILVNSLTLKVSGRPAKSTVAIVEKLKREKIRLSQIQDIAGCRIVVENVRVQDEICHAVSVMLRNVVVVDRRLKPTNGYRAVHLIVKHEGWFVEIQVRTQLQHAWAEISEKISDSFGQEIKYGKGADWAIEFLSHLSFLLTKLEAATTRIVDLKRNKKILDAEAAIRRKSPRKILEELEYQRRLLFYSVREHFHTLRDR